MKTYEGHPVHLDDGSWGVRVEGEGHEAVAVGDRLTVKSKGGKEWGATVTRVVDHNDYGTRVAARNDRKATAASASPLSTAGAPAVGQDAAGQGV